MSEECTKESCSSCSSKGSCPSSKEKPKFQVDANADSSIGRVIGIVSGKGGVGKSMVTASLANLLAEKGYRVGILDADITGPSIPRMYGLQGPALMEENTILPMAAANGVKVMSINLLLADENQPVIWRGPVIANMVKQFWTDVRWGEIDYLLVDMPPGTGDVPLTVFQSLPIDGVVIVSSPQDLVRMIVTKAVNMAGMMHIPVAGIVENYSYVECPDCGKHIAVFGESNIDEIAADLGCEVLGKMPIQPVYAAEADAGNFAFVANHYLDHGAEVAEKIEKRVIEE